MNNSPLPVSLSAWLVLAVVVLVMLAIDLFSHRGDHAAGRGSAVGWSITWVSLGVGFGGWVAARFGAAAAQDYLTAFLVEKSLSIDNLFVFLLVFERLNVPASEQHRVLQWGILGAFLIRAAFIAAGASLLREWHGVVYVLGAFLVYSGVQVIRTHGAPPDGEGKVIPFLKRYLPVTSEQHGHRFVALERGRRVATPLLLCLMVIEITDVVFAVDSVPAVFAVTEEPFIVYSSNVFAILGLRALFLVLASVLRDLKYLHYGLAGILVFTGVKMTTSRVVYVPHLVSLLAIAGILVAAIVPSLAARRRAVPEARVA